MEHQCIDGALIVIWRRGTQRPGGYLAVVQGGRAFVGEMGGEAQVPRGVGGGSGVGAGVGSVGLSGLRRVAQGAPGGAPGRLADQESAGRACCVKGLRGLCAVPAPWSGRSVGRALPGARAGWLVGGSLRRLRGSEGLQRALRGVPEGGRARRASFSRSGAYPSPAFQ